jgi:hypothetical protein
MIRLPGVLAQVDVDPSTDGMPGADAHPAAPELGQMLALWGSLGALLVGAAMYGLAREGGSYGGASAARHSPLAGWSERSSPGSRRRRSTCCSRRRADGPPTGSRTAPRTAVGRGGVVMVMLVAGSCSPARTGGSDPGRLDRPRRSSRAGEDPGAGRRRTGPSERAGDRWSGSPLTKRRGRSGGQRTRLRRSVGSTSPTTRSAAAVAEIATTVAAAPHDRRGRADVSMAREQLAASSGRVWWLVRPLAWRVEHFRHTGGAGVGVDHHDPVRRRVAAPAVGVHDRHARPGVGRRRLACRRRARHGRARRRSRARRTSRGTPSRSTSARRVHPHRRGAGP